ncbi:hypothetical protein D0Y65_018059 [Glycine soja]|uniref:Uncharacterized protein n=2 Tax=Glycine soja TaxID=3848 RepID=A0A445JXM7_GLYSO|nr:hypothetical protein D0Y65_018059 [Glycine soja]
MLKPPGFRNAFSLLLHHLLLALVSARGSHKTTWNTLTSWCCFRAFPLQALVAPRHFGLASLVDRGLFCEHQIRIWITTRMKERAAALAEGLPAPTLCSSGDVRDLNIEYFKYAHQHRITEGQNKVVITYRMWARLMSSTNQPSFTIAKTISEEKREEEANGHVPKAWSWSKAFIKEFDPSLYTLNKFSCIALAGVSTEYLIYGFSEGGLDDIRKLDLLLKGLGFTQKKADSHVRWPLLNTVLVLWRHEAARGKVAEALSMGKSIGSCIDIIENSINVSDLLLKL